MGRSSAALSRAVHAVIEQLESRRLYSSTLISGPGSITAGTPYTVNFNVPSQGSSSSWMVNWGDGSAAQSVAGTAASASHTYTGDVSSVQSITASLSSMPNPLDTSFGAAGSGGKVQTDLGTAADYAYDVKLIPASDPAGNGGKILVAGRVAVDSTHDQLVLLRYNADGTLDTSFGTSGSVKIANPNTTANTDAAYSVVIESNGNYLIAGGTRFTVARVSSTGSLLGTFAGTTGSTLGNSAIAYDMAQQSDGKIVLAGSNGTDFVVARLNTDLTLDTSFNSIGYRKTDFNSDIDQAFALAIDSSNRIVVVGEARKGTTNKDYDWALARYLPDGTLDSSFGTGGLAKLQFSSTKDDAAYDVAIQSDGKIVVGGYATSTDADFAIARFNDNGTLDTSFNGTGQQTTNFGAGTDQIYALSILNDGRIAAAGWAQSSSKATDFGVAIYLANGQPDTSFGTSGSLHTDFNGSTDKAEGIAVQPDGDLIVAGSASTVGSNGATDLALARYHVGQTGTISFGGGYQASFKFDTDNAAAVPGYITDIGNGYRQSSSGYWFGWIDPSNGQPAQNTDQTFDNAPGTPDLLDSGISTVNNGAPLTWEAAVPNGTYFVKLVAGNPGVTSGSYKYGVEGLNNFLSGTAGAGTARWITATSATNGLVTVTNGKLSIYDQGGANHTLAYVEITDASARNASVVAAPTEVVATASSSTAVDVRWRDNSDNETGFRIDRSIDNGSTWTQAGVANANAGVFQDTGLSAGATYSFRVVALKGSTAAASATVSITMPPSGVTQFGYNATRSPWSTGSPIQAEDFDAGGDNVADFDTSTGNAGGYYRASSTDIGLNIPSDRYFVGWTHIGDWDEYTINVPTAGTYQLQASVASQGQGGTFAISSNGTATGQSIVIPNTGSFLTYQTVTSLTFTLAAGTNVLRVTAVDDGVSTYYLGDMDSLQLVPVAAPPPTASIAGTVFNDANGNGSRDTGESGLSGWQVFADTNGNGVYNAGEPSATSATDGTYTLSGLTAGSYTILEVPQSGYTETEPAGGTYSVTLTAGQAAGGKDFGNKQTSSGGGNTGSIAGTVFNDANGNAVLDTGEFELAGWQVFADLNGNESFDAGEPSATSAADGTYNLSGLAAGNYTILETQQSGYTETAPASGTYAVTLTAGQAVTGKDFGDKQNTSGGDDTGSISGTVYNDANGNGVFDTGDSGLGGWQVYIDKDNSGTFTSGDIAATSGADGTYTFNNLAAGNYSILETTQSGYSETQPAGAYNVTLSEGQTATGKNFGNRQASGGGDDIVVSAIPDDAVAADEHATTIETDLTYNISKNRDGNTVSNIGIAAPLDSDNPYLFGRDFSSQQDSSGGVNLIFNRQGAYFVDLTEKTPDGETTHRYLELLPDGTFSEKRLGSNADTQLILQLRIAGSPFVVASSRPGLMLSSPAGPHEDAFGEEQPWPDDRD